MEKNNDYSHVLNVSKLTLSLPFLLFELIGIKAAMKRRKYKQEAPEERLLKEQKKSSRDEMAARHIKREKKRVRFISVFIIPPLSLFHIKVIR